MSYGKFIQKGMQKCGYASSDIKRDIFKKMTTNVEIDYNIISDCRISGRLSDGFPLGGRFES